MKRNYFIAPLFVIIILIFAVVGYNFIQKTTNQSSSQKPYPRYVRTLQGKDLPVLFRQEYVPSIKDWSIYVSEIFRFSIVVPPNMEIRHSVDIFEQEGKEYSYYSIYFTDTTTIERIFAVSIKETLLLTAEEYISKNGGYNGLIPEEKVISGVRVVSAISAQDPEHPQPEDSRERHLLFIRDGFFFDIVMRNMPIKDAERVSGSLNFFSE